MSIALIQDNIIGINFAIEFCCIIFNLVLLAATLLKKNSTVEMNAFAQVQIFAVIAMFADGGAYLASGHAAYYVIAVICNNLAYCCTVFYVAAFYRFIVTSYEKRYNLEFSDFTRWWALIYNILVIIVFLSSNWTHVIFYVAEDSTYNLGPYSFMAGAIMIPVILGCLAVICTNIRIADRRESVLYILFLAVFSILGSADATNITAMHFLAISVFGGIIYIREELEKDRVFAEKDREILVSELNALRLQMNPHYIYNTLASIDGLCVIDPEEARVLINKFAKHLRASYLDDMPKEIPIEKELENLEAYIAVESVRFPRLQVEYKITAKGFNIPPLIVQPIVENAIKHGICNKPKNAGKVTIATCQKGDNYIIRVTDDGVGFDTTKPQAEDGRSHIGINNTRKRLELLCGGRLEIDSIPGLGTTADIIIPKEKKL